MRQYVGVILVKPDGSVLAQHRDDKPDILGPNTWCAIGGARDKDDDDLKNTGARELKEETGYEMHSEELCFLVRDTYTTEKDTPVERTIFWALYDGEQVIECLEGQEMRFIQPQEFDGLDFYTGHESFMRRASEKILAGGIERR